MYNKHFVANCPEYVPMKNFENWLIFGKDMKNGKVGRF